ncbi:MAG TPA: DUF5683 domain-containing protein [Cytophagaceae bacterium]|nr:DUF5683 domain-containing protein [Cytophagaceae bacterium]
MNKFHIIAVAIFLWGNLLCSSHTAMAQQPDTVHTSLPDSITRKLPPDDEFATGYQPESFDTLKAARKIKQPLSAPKKALLLSLALPGAGQAYNKKYWKMPILYAGIAACAYFWVTNQQAYHEFKNAYDRNYIALQANPDFIIYEDHLKYGSLQVYTSLAQLSTDRDTYHRYRDLSIAGSVALYAIAALDAYVDAHLKEFDLSPDLSLSVKPTFFKYYNNNATFTPGISMGLRFKNNRSFDNQLYK